MKRKLDEHDVPQPITEFSGFGLSAPLIQAVSNAKHATPTPVQAQAIPLILEGKSVLARAKTGTGKTLAYLLPLLDNAVRRSKTTSALILVPSKELAQQVTTAIRTYSQSCSPPITCANLAKKESEQVTRASLSAGPAIVVATPAGASQWIDNGTLKAAGLQQLVIDEADLVLSYGYKDDLESIAAALPASVQAVLMSATLRPEVDELTKLFCKGNTPEILDLQTAEAEEKSSLSQYIVPTAEDEKWLLIYAILKLQIIKGKIIVFVADTDRCYRVKLFLEQFGIRSCILNAELPVNSRLHVVEEFNRGVYDILVAADDNEVIGDETAKGKKRKISEEDSKKDKSDKEFGVARGIDFRRVACVLNFDLPTSANSYTHRIGRTARAGQQGMALSFFVPKEHYRKHKPTSIPQCEHDETTLEAIRKEQEEHGATLEEWQFDMDKLAGFRYRLVDALRAVTRIAVRQARTKELRQELINSAKLQRHFEEHPEDLRHLRHDTETHVVRHQQHLKHVPDYLLPTGGKASIKKDVGFVGLRSNTDKFRKGRTLNKARGKGRQDKGKKLDPLKSFNARGKGKN